VCLFHIKYGTSLKQESSHTKRFVSVNGIGLYFIRSDRLVQKVDCKSECQKRKRKRNESCITDCEAKNMVTKSLRSDILKFMSSYKPEILIINTGAHFTRGKHGNEELAFKLFTIAVDSVLDYMYHIEWNISVIWRLSHVNLYSHGDWDTFGHCNVEIPGAINLHPILSERVKKQNAYVTKKINTLQNMRSNALFSVLDVYTLSVDRADAMCGILEGGRWDCTHFCSPGVIDVWNILLLSSMKRFIKS